MAKTSKTTKKKTLPPWLNKTKDADMPMTKAQMKKMKKGKKAKS